MLCEAWVCVFGGPMPALSWINFCASWICCSVPRIMKVFQLSPLSLAFFSIWTNAPEFSLISRMFSPPFPMTTPARLAGTGYSTQCCPCLKITLGYKKNSCINYIKLESLLPWRGGCCSCNFCRAISEILSFAIWQASGVPLIEQERTSWVGSSVLNWILVFVSFWILEIFSPPLPITTPTAAFGT